MQMVSVPIPIPVPVPLADEGRSRERNSVRKWVMCFWRSSMYGDELLSMAASAPWAPKFWLWIWRMVDSRRSSMDWNREVTESQATS